MGPFWDTAAHNLGDLAIAIPLALQISFNFLVALIQYRLTAQLRHMGVSQLTELPLDLWRHRMSSPTIPCTPTLFDECLVLWITR